MSIKKSHFFSSLIVTKNRHNKKCASVINAMLPAFFEAYKDKEEIFEKRYIVQKPRIYYVILVNMPIPIKELEDLSKKLKNHVYFAFPPHVLKKQKIKEFLPWVWFKGAPRDYDEEILKKVDNVAIYPSPNVNNHIIKRISKTKTIFLPTFSFVDIYIKNAIVGDFFMDNDNVKIPHISQEDGRLWVTLLLQRKSQLKIFEKM